MVQSSMDTVSGTIPAPGAMPSDEANVTQRNSADVMQTASSAGGARRHNPPVELPQTSATNFFEEAKVEAKEEEEVRRKFNRFATKHPQGDPSEYLTFEEFCNLMQHYECTGAEHWESYFYSMDRGHDDRLGFAEFFLGVCAADPHTTHILNSFTGHERSKYIFDFYDIDRDDFLGRDEFLRLHSDLLKLQMGGDLDDAAALQESVNKATELGLYDKSGNFHDVDRELFYSFIERERMRGTSRLFRFQKSILTHKTAKSGRRHGSTGGTPGGAHRIAAVEDDNASDTETLDWHALLLSAEADLDPAALDPPDSMGDGGQESSSASSSYRYQLPTPLRSGVPGYGTLLPPAPPLSAWRNDLDLRGDFGEVQALATNILGLLSRKSCEGLVPFPSSGSPDFDDSSNFTLASPAQLRSLSMAVQELLGQEVVVPIVPPVKFFGSLHGQLLDLLSFFKWFTTPSMDKAGDLQYCTYVFLGNYGDRGMYSLEVLSLLFSLKVICPHNVVLLRGAHENRHVNYHLGLRTECERRLGSIEGSRVYEQLNRTFEYMPLAATLGSELFAFGGVSIPSSPVGSLESLQRLRKPLSIPHPQHPRAAQSPDREIEELMLELYTPRSLLHGTQDTTNEVVTASHAEVFCRENNFVAVVMSNYCPPRGFSFDAGGQVLTLTSCCNYCDEVGGNDAAMLTVMKPPTPDFAYEIRAHSITARVAELYRVLGNAASLGMPSPGPELPPRWPLQPRASTPGRARTARGAPSNKSPSGLLAGGPGGVSPAEALSAALTFDRRLELRRGSYDPLPAFGPGRPVGGIQISRARKGHHKGDTPSSDHHHHHHHRERDHREKERIERGGDLGIQQGSEFTYRGPANTSSAARRAPSAGGASGAVMAAQDLAPEDTRRGSRTPSVGGVQGPPAASLAARRSNSQAPPGQVDGPGGRSTSLIPNNGGSMSANSTGANNIAASVTASAGAAGGRPAREGSAVAANRRTSSSVLSRENQVPQIGPQPSQRGPSRPPAGGPSCGGKAVSPSPPSQSVRRRAGEVPGSPRARPPTTSLSGSGNLKQSLEAAANGAPDAEVTDLSTLQEMLKSSTTLPFRAIPHSPVTFLALKHSPMAVPLVLHLCHLWLESGLSDPAWEQATETYVKVSQKNAPGTKGERKWDLSDFTAWASERGITSQEDCMLWFKAFDLDKDGFVNHSDFLHGLVATAAPIEPQPGSRQGLCSAVVLHSLLGMDRNFLGPNRLRSILQEARIPSPGDDALEEFSHNLATNFELFRGTMLPVLRLPQFRLSTFNLADGA